MKPADALQILSSADEPRHGVRDQLYDDAAIVLGHALEDLETLREAVQRFVKETAASKDGGQSPWPFREVFADVLSRVERSKP